MSKLTPPSPRHPTKRSLFFLKYPNHPKAKSWLDKMSLTIGQQAYLTYNRLLAKGLKPDHKKITQKLLDNLLKGKSHANTKTT